jgi:hypothetical protein
MGTQCPRHLKRRAKLVLADSGLSHLLRLRLRGRLYPRLRGRLRRPSRVAPSPNFRCTSAGSAASPLHDISTSASKSSAARPLTCEPSAVGLAPLRCSSAKRQPARSSAQRPTSSCGRSPAVTRRRSVPLADRVVASRRCSSTPRPLIPDAGVRAPAWRSCTGRSPLRRRPAGRCRYCPAAARGGQL